ncbi:hypothetical protein [Cellulomonas cellasea]|uniref:Gram-positive cocci surface proteins LPxTG domain-containing protein n=1 Tax=Cellulomonas cellasea TaxID=43670 RepID=A0A7W4UFZ7_9CELL|nr:hypothetical protein [Cellulomonas cellasea]MBB2923496.1 hypothetical protein [Cellulomonas cellasea]
MARPDPSRRHRLLLALAALALPLGTGVAASPAAAVGSGDLFPDDAVCGTGTGAGCRAPIEWNVATYGPPDGTHIVRRTLFTVFARQGEQLLLGSSALGVAPGRADVAVWEPGAVTDTEAATLPAPASSCAAQREAAGDPALGLIATRTQELAGPRSVDGTGNPDGYVPCVHTVTTTGLHRVAFYGSIGPGGALSGGVPTRAQVRTGVVAQAESSTTVAAWDLTVRPAAPGSTADLRGRVFTYVYAGFTGGSDRPTDFSTYITTTDGFRYRVATRSFDPFGFVFYGNPVGFYDADGVTPLHRDVLGSGSNQQTLTDPLGGVRLARAEYPVSVEPLAPETLDALGIPAQGAEPVMGPLGFAGSAGGGVAFEGQGGGLRFSTGTRGTYEIVLSRDGASFDAGAPGNRVLRGLVGPGTHDIPWDGLDNAGVPFPAGQYPVRATLRGGEYHAPILDVESSLRGGPSITLENPPDGVCPFTGEVSTGTNCTRGFYDDRGYVTSAGVAVGTPGELLCAGVGTRPSVASADPDLGFDTTSGQRAFGAGAGANTNTQCTGSFGDAKGLDLWSYVPGEARTSVVVVVPPAAPAPPPAAPAPQDPAPPAVPAEPGVPAAPAAPADPAAPATRPGGPSSARTDPGTRARTPREGRATALARTGSDVTPGLVGLGLVVVGGALVAAARGRRRLG